MSSQYQQQLDDIMSHEVSRSEFVKYIGVAVLGLVGVTSFLKNLHDNVQPLSKRSAKQLAKQLSDYGMSDYGR